MRADRRKNGRFRKYHYSKIQNAGDCVARTGVREIGFKFGSLPHDPEGITCMCMLQRLLFSFFAKLNLLITTIGIITIWTGMLGTIFGIEIVMIKKNLSFP